MATSYAITPGSVSVSEGAGTQSFTITRSGGLPAETVYASTAQGEGYTNSGDYTGLSNQSLSFALNQTTATVTVAITNDTVVESNETFGLVVQRNTSDPLTTYLAKTTFTIVDNDTLATGTSTPDTVRQGTDTTTTLAVNGVTNGTIDSEPLASDISISLADGSGGYVDKDWYKVTLNKGNVYTFAGSATSLTTGLMDIALYGQNGTQAHAAVEGASPSFTFDTAYQSSATQTYFVAVSAGGSAPTWKTATGNYSVTLTSQVSSTTLDQIPKSIQSTTQMPLGTTLGTIDSADVSGGTDDDYYAVTLIGGDKYTFIANAGVSSADTLDSVVIRLRDSNGNILATGDMTAAGTNPSFDYSVPGSGSRTYYLAISASTAGSGSGLTAADKTGQYQITLAHQAAVSQPTSSVSASGFDPTIVSGGSISFGFGTTKWGAISPNTADPDQLLTHPAVDIKAILGSKVDSFAAGDVVEVDKNDYLGWYVRIHHSGTSAPAINGADDFYTLYSHLQYQPLVSVGQSVSAGQHIGEVGTTGNESVQNGYGLLHFEIRLFDGLLHPWEWTAWDLPKAGVNTTNIYLYGSLSEDSLRADPTGTGHGYINPANFLVENGTATSNAATTLSNATSASQIGALKQGIDYSRGTNLSPTDVAVAGKSFVGRYIGVTDGQGYLRPAEAAQLTQAGLTIVSIYERNPTTISYFTPQQAIDDARDAISAAQKAGQPVGSAIYFTVDMDPGRGADGSTNLAIIDKYFQGISSYFSQHESPYSIGVYGAGDVLRTVLSDSSVGAKYTWLAYAPGWAGNNTFSSENIEQTRNSTPSNPINLGGAIVDLDVAHTQSFGAWGDITVSSDSIQQESLVGSAGLLTIQASTNTGTNLTVSSQGQNVVVSHGDTGNVLMQAIQFAELLFTGGTGNDTLTVGQLSGTDIANHTVLFNGMDGNDHLDASTTDKTIVARGGNGDDFLASGSGDDVLEGGAGQDTLVGGSGIDTSAFSGGSTEYFVTYDALSSTYSVKDAVSSRDGTDKLTSVELLQFSDGVRQLATSDALSVQRVHQALFGKAQGSAAFSESLLVFLNQELRFQNEEKDSPLEVAARVDSKLQ